jgi:hypothetical protein
MECPLSQTVTQINGMPPFTNCDTNKWNAPFHKDKWNAPFHKDKCEISIFLIVKQTSIALSSS